jgi:hypothetical protein
LAGVGLVTPPRGGWRRASGAIAAGLAKQEVCIPAEARSGGGRRVKHHHDVA